MARQSGTYDADNEVSYASGSTTLGTLTYTHAAADRLASRGSTLFQSVLPNALTSATYDAANRLTQRIASGITITPSWDANGSLSGAQTTLYTYSTAFNQVLSVTDPLGDKTTFTLGALDALSAITDPLGHKTSVTLNPAGQVVTTTDALGHKTTLVYDHGDLSGITTPLGRVTRLYTDAIGRVLTTTDPLGGVRRFAYDAIDGVKTATDANGHAIGYSYDAQGLLLTRTDAAGKVSHVTSRDGLGNLTGSSDRKAQATTRTYDALGRLSGATYADGGTTGWTYDLGNRPTQAPRPARRAPSPPPAGPSNTAAATGSTTAWSAKSVTAFMAPRAQPAGCRRTPYPAGCGRKSKPATETPGDRPPHRERHRPALRLSPDRQAVADHAAAPAPKPGDRLSRHAAADLSPVRRARAPPGRCAGRPRRTPRRHGGGDGLGQSSLPGMLLRHPMSGAVLMTVNVRLSPEQVLYTLNHAQVDVILCNSEFVPLLAALQPLLTTAKTFVCITDDGTIPDLPEGVAWAGDYEALLAQADPAHAFPDFDERTRATTFYTTGTTGNPKGVYYSHRRSFCTRSPALATMSFRPDDVYMPITPMFHVHAWGNPYNATARGIKQVYPGRYQPDLLARLYVKERVTFSHCVPTILQMFLNAAKDVDLRGWRVIVGGSALPRALAQTALDRGIDVFAGYGMSETGPMATLSLVPPELRDGGETELTYRCRAGRPVPLCDVRIVDADMRDLPHDGASTRRGGDAFSLADHGLPGQPRGERRALGRRLAAHRRHRRHRRPRIPHHHRPHQGRGQDRRRMGQQPAARRHHRRTPLGRRSGRDRLEGSALGRTPGRHHRAEARRRTRCRQPARPMSCNVWNRA